MSDVDLFCVECGTTTADLDEENVCRTCFSERLTPVTLPPQVEVEICAHCGARKRGETWQRPPPDLARPVEEAVMDVATLDARVEQPAVFTRVQEVDPRTWEAVVEVRGRVGEWPVEGEATTTVRVRRGTCTKCSRFRGGYFEGIVQVRARDRPLDEDELRGTRLTASRVVEAAVDGGDPHAFVLKDEEVDGGLDVYVGTITTGRAMARAIGERWGGRVTEHPKLVGQRDGVDLYRITFGVRLAPFRPGDVVGVDDEPWVVQTIGTKRVHLLHPHEGTQRTVERDHLRAAPRVRSDDAREAVVVSRTSDELQVLDPDTYATVTVRRPTDLGDDADTVPVIRWEDRLHAIPPRVGKD